MFSSRVTCRPIKIGCIPALFYEPMDQEALGSVIHYHGWSSKKENHDFMASSLCAAGYRVLLPDSLYHGERGTLEYEEEFEKMPEVILQSIDEFPLLYAFLKSETVALTGHSMGSMIAAGPFHTHSSISKAAIINGYCDFKEGFKEWKERAKDLLDYDPMRHLHRIGNRKLLILHGDADSSVSIDVQRNYVKKAKDYFQDGHLLYEEIPNLNHYITLAMLAKTIEFLGDL